ncbi:MbcA/ParS/Xre antitoxin family protein [Maritimibacter sp. DP1N21-5]|uniref:MbcA/ParS/Xre antitoxin family protein n=1 Tax=Maritimibacter sp. DP1N21-5 TaxID=2836867 RepID=UPI001C466C2B|nr:MbcA/ParS/Xre antitoxin family protein [Maritimibacter sp. DP1N21-5]MBV7409957.1 MbcA/ParS/Xre antitoxin family protein [Maritimibacter sp. DP1N21-5]
MTIHKLNSAAVSDRGTVLTKALLSASTRLGLTGARLAEVIGVSGPTVSRMAKGAWVLEDGSKPFELAALFLRLFRSLDAITGGDEAVARAWLVADNRALGMAPVQAIRNVEGLVRVTQYLDARRAPL